MKNKLVEFKVFDPLTGVKVICECPDDVNAKARVAIYRAVDGICAGFFKNPDFDLDAFISGIANYQLLKQLAEAYGKELRYEKA